MNRKVRREPAKNKPKILLKKKIIYTPTETKFNYILYLVTVIEHDVHILLIAKHSFAKL